MDFEPCPPAAFQGGIIAIASLTASFPPISRLHTRPVRTEDKCTVQPVVSIEDRELDSPPSGQDIERSLRRNYDLHVLPSHVTLHFRVRIGRIDISKARSRGLERDPGPQGNTALAGEVVAELAGSWVRVAGVGIKGAVFNFAGDPALNDIGTGHNHYRLKFRYNV